MKTSAYIIKDGKIIATIDTALKNGANVVFSRKKCVEAINASRGFNLVNAQTGKVSRAKKWEKESYQVESATEINEGEFLI
jgi:hypothetical protein